MSARGLFKGFKKPKPVVPRQLDDINKEYSDLVSKAGQCQYQIHVFTKDLENTNQRLLSLNQEAHARNELTKKELPALTPAPEVEAK